jgi:phosphate transport system permease protein
MSDASVTPSDAPQKHGKSLLIKDARTKKRDAAEKRFKAYGIAAILVGLFFLIALLWAIIQNGTPAFTQTFANLEVELLEERLDPNGTRDIEDLKKTSTFGYKPLIEQALIDATADIDTEVTDGDLAKILSSSAAAVIRDFVLENPCLIGVSVEFRLLTSSRVDGYM